MAKKTAKSRRKSVPSLKAPLARALKSAKALKGKVAQAAELEALITHLKKVQTLAEDSCPTKVYSRTFSLVSKASKVSKKR
jgi:hypothetical protein